MLGFDLHLPNFIQKNDWINNLDMASYRKISDEEIGQLVMQGCSSDDWNLVEVSDRFNADSIVNTRFSGYNKIGKFDEKVKLLGGITFNTDSGKVRNSGSRVFRRTFRAFFC